MSVLSEKVLKEVEKYEGLWVAVAEDGVLAYGHSAKEVLEEAERKTSKEVTVFKVPRRDEEMHVL